MTKQRLVRYLVIALGTAIALAIIVLTVVNVRKVQNRQVEAQEVDCRYNWCQAVISRSGNNLKIKISRPYRATYPASSFVLDLPEWLGKQVKVKGVVRNNLFYVTQIKPAVGK